MTDPSIVRPARSVAWLAVLPLLHLSLNRLLPMGALLPACFPEKNYVRAVMIVMRFVPSDLDQSSIFKQRRPAARLATHSLQSSKLDQLQQEHLHQTSTASERDPKLAAATTSRMHGPNTHHIPVVSPTNTACTQGPLHASRDSKR